MSSSLAKREAKKSVLMIIVAGVVYASIVALVAYFALVAPSKADAPRNIAALLLTAAACTIVDIILAVRAYHAVLDACSGIVSRDDKVLLGIGLWVAGSVPSTVVFTVFLLATGQSNELTSSVLEFMASMALVVTAYMRFRDKIK